MMRMVAVVTLFAACGSSDKPIEIGETGKPFGAVANVRLGMTVDDRVVDGD